MSFTEVEEERLIKIVSNYPVLYDVKHVDYRNQVVKENIWTSIAGEIGKTNDATKKKWKFIRDGYVRFKKTHLHGSVASKHAKKKRHKLLSFLDKARHESEEQARSPSPPKLEKNAEEPIKVEPQEEGYYTEVILNCKQEKDSSVEIEFDTFNEELEEEMTQQVAHEDTLKTTDALVCQNETMVRHDDTLANRWKSVTNKKRKRLLKKMPRKKEDDVDYFCRHMGEVLRKLPPLEKAQAKQQLNAVLSEYEIIAARNTMDTTT